MIKRLPTFLVNPCDHEDFGSLIWVAMTASIVGNNFCLKISDTASVY